MAACTSAEPPPGMTPSSTAARVAAMASSMRCFFSLISTSVAAPTRMTPMPPASLASRSCSFSRSQSESVSSISRRICATRSPIASAVPPPSTIVVVVLGDGDPAGGAEHLEADLVELEADVLADHLAAGDDGEVGHERLAAVAEVGRLHRDDLDGLADRVDDEGRQRLALDVLGDDQQRPAAGSRAPSPAAGAGRPARRSCR